MCAHQERRERERRREEEGGREEAGRERTPVPAAGQALVLGAADLGGEEAAAGPRVDADAPLPLLHLAALQRVCAGL